MRRALALVAIIFLFTTAYPQDITVKSSPDTSSIIIGDQIRLLGIRNNTIRH